MPLATTLLALLTYTTPSDHHVLSIYKANITLFLHINQGIPADRVRLIGYADCLDSSCDLLQLPNEWESIRLQIWTASIRVRSAAITIDVYSSHCIGRFSTLLEKRLRPITVKIYSIPSMRIAAESTNVAKHAECLQTTSTIWKRLARES